MSPEPIPPRLIVLPEDMGKFFGELIPSKRGRQAKLRRIKKALGKEPWQHVTIYEFAAFEGFEIDDVIRILSAKTSPRSA